MFRISLFFTFFITIIHSASAQYESVNEFVGRGQTLEHRLHSTPYKPQIMTIPNYGTATWLGGDDLLGVLGDNTLLYIPKANYIGVDTLKVGYWQWTNFGPVFTQRFLHITIGEGEKVSGQLFFDQNNNCLLDDGEPARGQQILRIVNAEYEAFTNTDAQGNYSIFLPIGTYEVMYVDDNPNWRNCADLIPLVIEDTGTEIIYNIPVQAVSSQPYLTVDLAAPRLLRCFSSTYTISYCNESTISIADPYIEVVLDPFLEYQNATLNLTEQRGDTLCFDLPELAIDECGRFRLFVKVSCEAELGRTHCTEANIYPQPEIPLVAQLAVIGDCYGDKLVFVIKNIGNADMTDEVQYFVIEDQVVYLKEDVQLEMGDSVIISRPTNGQTVRVEVDQVDDFFYDKIASKTIEACTDEEDEEVSLGFVNQFSQPDEAPFTAIDCQENRGAFDPNDKQAFPTGVPIGDDNFIYKNTDLEYLIRFQNTGTDTAYTVVVKDTLSQNLTLKTLQIGAASHDFTWQLLPDRTLQFSFDNILLPDSTTNEEASHGFVQFRIAQKIDLPVSSEIHNHAAIFFDFNLPIITNTVSHMIGEKFLNIARPQRLAKPVVEIGTFLQQVNVFPNPAKDKVYFRLPVMIRQPAHLLIFNNKMQQVVKRKAMEELIGIDTRKWESGLYFWLLDDGEHRWDGRLIIEK